MRQLHPVEQTVADAVVRLGTMQRWEFAAFLESPTGPCIEIRTTMSPSVANPSLDVLQKKGGGQLVCHHNHLSQESLSSADWRGLAELFKETWAHCADETRYYGRVLDVKGVERVLSTNYVALESRAETDLFNLLNAQNHPEAVSLAATFRKEALNRALLIRCMVEYESDWGTSHVRPPAPQGLPQLVHHVGYYGPLIAAELHRAAQALAPSL